jgi:hypothetical protein
LKFIALLALFSLFRLCTLCSISTMESRRGAENNGSLAELEAISKNKPDETRQTPDTGLVSDKHGAEHPEATNADNGGEPQNPASIDTPSSHMPSPDDAMVPTTNVQFLLIFIALILAIFCVALDNTIIVTAIPRITDTFDILNDVGW